MMKLRYSTASPFVRKVMVTAIELGIRDQLELVTTDVWSSETDIRSDNPLGKVPALTLETGQVLYDSPVICAYLNSLSHPVDLLSGTGDDHWTTLRIQALADGIMDAGVLCLLESRRPETLQSQAWIERQQTTIRQGFDQLEKDVPYLIGAPVSLAHISAGAAVDWLRFRKIADVFEGRPALQAWFSDFSKRASMQETEPYV